jgi:hypothetical protein
MSKWAEPSVSGLNERDVDVAMEKREHVLAGSDENDEGGRWRLGITRG